jgi:hypothetical protein
MHIDQQLKLKSFLPHSLPKFLLGHISYLNLYYLPIHYQFLFFLWVHFLLLMEIPTIIIVFTSMLKSSYAIIRPSAGILSPILMMRTSPTHSSLDKISICVPFLMTITDDSFYSFISSLL